jgi:serine/threonine protein kinase
MQKPATLTDAVAVLRKSRLVAEERLVPYLDAVPHVLAPVELFADMVRHGLLTRFQASQLETGRWRGFEIGNYRVLDRLGQGGMGAVFLAEHVTLGKRVAVKVLNRTRGASELALERFVREAKAAAKLNHPNIIQVFDISTTSTPPYLVMEYVDGVTMQAAVARNGPLAPGDAAYIARQIALGLDEAFRHGIVHRDVKPANILVDRHGGAKLLDLGIIRIDGEAITCEYAGNIILGTLDYCSPEQSLDSSAVDTRADLYSLGASMFFMLTGMSPLPTGPVKQRLHELQNGKLSSIQALRPEMPPQLVAVLQRMLATNPADRYQTPAETAEALAPFAQMVPPFPASLFRDIRTTLSDSEAGAATPPTGILTGAETPTPGALNTFVEMPLPSANPGDWPFDAQIALAIAQSAEMKALREESRTELVQALQAQKRRHLGAGLLLLLLLAVGVVAWAILKK